MLAIDIEPGDELHNAADELVWMVLWTWEYDRTTKGLRIRWASDQGETDRAYRNDVELNIVRPAPPAEGPPPEEPPAEDPPPSGDPETPPAEDPPPPDPGTLEGGENAVTPDDQLAGS